MLDQVDGVEEDSMHSAIRERIDALGAPLERRKQALDSSKGLYQLLRLVMIMCKSFRKRNKKFSSWNNFENIEKIGRFLSRMLHDLYMCYKVVLMQETRTKLFLCFCND